MENQIQKTEQHQIKPITKENWQAELALLPIKTDSPLPEVLKLGTPQISTFNAGTGSTENGIQVFEILIQAIVKFYGIGWGKQQREVAEMMHDKYYWLHIAEIRLFTLKAKSGEYNRKDWQKTAGGEMEEWDGKIYGQLTPATLFKWMERFAEESLLERGNMRIENLKAKNEPEAIITPIAPERMAELVAGFTEQALSWKANEPDPEQRKKDRIEQRKMMSGHDTVPQEVRDDVHERFLELKCKIVAEAIAGNWEEAMLPEYRQIQANHPDIVAKYLQEIKDAA